MFEKIAPSADKVLKFRKEREPDRLFRLFSSQSRGFPELLSMDLAMDVIDSPVRMRELADTLRQSASPLGLVPTMGALHEGHLSLIQRSVSECATTVVSIFVNPAQFGPGEDLDTYPRTFHEDLEVCRQEGVAAVYAPSAGEMYANGFDTWVEVPSLASRLCAPHRPGHFRGVATVIVKLFSACKPDRAYFGEKDYQQLVLIRRMAGDLDMGVEIVACPTVREADGLAMSSRNINLRGEERGRSLSLRRGLFRARELFARGEGSAAVLIQAAREELDKARAEVDYIEVVDAETLAPLETVESPCRMVIAAKIGFTRLIDNIPLEP
jgi:pantoate--beta-alanine ligase